MSVDITRRSLIASAGALAVTSLVDLPAKSQSAPAARYRRRHARIIRVPDGQFHMWSQANPLFRQLLSQYFPSLVDNKDFSKFARMCFILKNDTSRNVRAFSARWSARNPTSTTKFTLFHYTKAFSGSAATEVRGLSASTDLMLAGQVDLVCPFFRLSQAQVANGDFENLLASATKDSLRKYLASSLPAMTHRRIWLDAVLFSDGTFAGPNRGRLIGRIISEQRSQIRVCRTLWTGIGSGLSRNKILAMLEREKNVHIDPSALPLRRWRLYARRDCAQWLIDHHHEWLRSPLLSQIIRSSNGKPLVAVRNSDLM